MLGKAFPYPQRVQVWCFARGSRRTEPGYGASRAYKTAQRLQLQHSGSMHPPPRLPLFALSGATSAGSRSSGQRQQGRAGQLQGRSRTAPSAGRTSQAVQGVKVGARIAPNAFATADGGDCTEALRRFRVLGASLLGSRQSVPQSYPTAAAM